jgi:hypothetical protein
MGADRRRSDDYDDGGDGGGGGGCGDSHDSRLTASYRPQ